MRPYLKVHFVCYEGLSAFARVSRDRDDGHVNHWPMCSGFCDGAEASGGDAALLLICSYNLKACLAMAQCLVIAALEANRVNVLVNVTEGNVQR